MPIRTLFRSIATMVTLMQPSMMMVSLSLRERTSMSVTSVRRLNLTPNQLQIVDQSAERPEGPHFSEASENRDPFSSPSWQSCVPFWYICPQNAHHDMRIRVRQGA